MRAWNMKRSFFKHTLLYLKIFLRMVTWSSPVILSYRLLDANSDDLEIMRIGGLQAIYTFTFMPSDKILNIVGMGIYPSNSWTLIHRYTKEHHVLDTSRGSHRLCDHGGKDCKWKVLSKDQNVYSPEGKKIYEKALRGQSREVPLETLPLHPFISNEGSQFFWSASYYDWNFVNQAIWHGQISHNCGLLVDGNVEIL